jgi:hypothetical protein
MRRWDCFPVSSKAEVSWVAPPLMPELNRKADKDWLRFAARQVYRADAGGTLGAVSAKAVMTPSCHRFGSSFAG